MSALRAIRCGCDPQEVAGLPGLPCPRCRCLREAWSSHTAMVATADARDTLEFAMGLADKALIADDDGNESRRNRDVLRAAEAAQEAANALAFAAASLHESGRPAIGVVGAHDQRPGRH